MIQFSRDGVAFSRVNSYEDWPQFIASAKRAWLAFVEIAVPIEIQRLGVRFINHFPTAKPETIGNILKDPPTRPSHLPLSEFTYQSTFTVPDQPYGIRVIKVMQQSGLGQTQGSGLFLDFDVYTTKPIPFDDPEMNDKLTQMRWLKNNIFFSLLTDNAIEELQ